MEEMTAFEDCACAHNFEVDGNEVRGGNLFDHSKLGLPVKIPFLAPMQNCDQPTDELDFTLLRRYGITLSVPTESILSREWQERWLGAWSNQRVDVMEAGRTREWARALLLQGGGTADIDVKVCDQFREKHVPLPMEYSYSGDWNANNQRCGQGTMKWQIFISAGDIVHRWQYSYSGSWQNGKRNVRDVT